jgi:hypothetical protein
MMARGHRAGILDGEASQLSPRFLAMLTAGLQLSVLLPPPCRTQADLADALSTFPSWSLSPTID